MSFILEALRKAERERSLGQVPTLEAKSAPEPDTPRRLWPWLVAGALLINAAVLALWLYSPRVTDLPPATATALPGPPSPIAPPPPEPMVADYLPPPVTVVEEPISEPPVTEVPEAPPEPRTGTDTYKPPPAPIEYQDDYGEEAAVEETSVTGEPPSELRDMPRDFRRSLPAMKIDAHFYTDVPGRSFVMINLRKYKPGERLAEGPQVMEIVPEGVVLSYQGRQFLLKP